MIGLGTIINVICIIAGGILGLLFGNRLKPSIQNTVMSITGVCVIMLGIQGALEGLFVTKNGSMIMIISLAVGAIIGELVGIEDKIIKLGEWLKKKSGSSNDTSFIDAFVNSSCTVCIGAMAVVGAINDGINHDYTTLLAKGILDAIIICIMTASMGKGCVFSAVPVAVFQGVITAIAAIAGNFLPAKSVSYLSFTGSVLIFCVGLNLIRDKKIRVANILPGIFIAAILGIFF